MDWSGRRLLFSGRGVGDNTLGERGRFYGADLYIGSVACWVAALDDLFFAASLDASRGFNTPTAATRASFYRG